MEWSALAVATVAAGALLAGCAALPLSGRIRLFAVLFGMATVMAGVGAADEGISTWAYPGIQLALAVVAIGDLLLHAYKDRGPGHALVSGRNRS